MTIPADRVRPPARIGVALLVLVCSAAESRADVADRWDELLSRYVIGDGVNYAAWRASERDSRELSVIVAELASTDPAGLDPADRHALYINLYNARIVEIVLIENPPESIRDVTWTWFGYGVFYRNDFVFDGKKISLNGLEKRLRKESADPRIHFAVNCASISCPPLAAEAYRGERLDEQLERGTREFLADPANLIFEDRPAGSRKLRLRVSKIFDWYSGDFGDNAGVIRFITRHAPPEIARRLDAAGNRVKLTYLDYDWRLNRAAPQPSAVARIYAGNGQYPQQENER